MNSNMTQIINVILAKSGRMNDDVDALMVR